MKKNGLSRCDGDFLGREELVTDLAFDDFAQGDISVVKARSDLDHGTMPLGELTHALRDNIDQNLLVRDQFDSFIKKGCGHIYGKKE